MKKVFRILSFFPVIFSSIILINGCASSDLQVSEFRFKYNNKDYIIRSSYCPDNPASCNQLIGNDFIAVDMNQDRIIDKINEGNITLAEAQEIYDYSLDLLKKQNKLNEVGRREKNYLITETNFNYEIKTFTPEIGRVFNEFKIIDKRLAWGKTEISLFLDENADGILNNVLRGKIPASEAQKKYEMTISKGLANNNLIKINGSIIIK